MCGDEVFEDLEAFPEVGPDRRLDDLARRLGHEATHPGKLPDLLGRAPGARVCHHVDGVKGTFTLGPLIFQGGNNLIGYLLCDLGPDIDDLVVPFTVGDETLRVLGLDLGNIFFSSGHQFSFPGGNVHIIHADRQAGLRGVGKAEGLEVIEQVNGLLVTGLHERHGDELTQFLLPELPVDHGERDLFRNDIGKEHPAHCRVDDLTFVPHLDSRLKRNDFPVVGHANHVEV